MLSAVIPPELIERGKELYFHPDFMRVRYENWVHGLNGDWLISRQRFFGVQTYLEHLPSGMAGGAWLRQPVRMAAIAHLD